MSDLAPFVAAQLRDGTVTELIEENRRLRETVQQQKLVQIVQGEHIYAEGFLEQGEYNPDPVQWNRTVPVFPEWSVNLEHKLDCPVENLENLPDNTLQVRIGGLPIFFAAGGSLKLDTFPVGQFRVIPYQNRGQRSLESISVDIPFMSRGVHHDMSGGNPIPRFVREIVENDLRVVRFPRVTFYYEFVKPFMLLHEIPLPDDDEPEEADSSGLANNEEE